MKLLIASDIHGAASYCRQLMAAIEREGPDRVVLLGDLLYHGPRNDLPSDYDPRQVVSMLNSIADKVVAVRGNCEAEVDQMVLDFPCMADCATLFDPEVTNAVTGTSGRALFLTHGHVWGPGIHNSVDRMPSLAAGSAIVYGHTHRKVNAASESHPGIWCFNPGSVGIPKDGSHSFGVYENGHFDHRGL